VVVVAYKDAQGNDAGYDKAYGLEAGVAAVDSFV
jgi:hypothetical protein